MAKQTLNQSIPDKKSTFFKSDLKTDTLQTAFANIYETHLGNWQAIKTELTPEKGFTPEMVKNLEFTHHLSNWSNDNEKLITLFQSDTSTNSTRDIALKLNKTDFINKVMDTAPSGTPEEKTAFATNLHNALFHIEPTSMVVNMVRDPQIPILNDAIGGNVATVLEKQADFNIKTTSIYTILNNEETFKNIPKESQEAVKTQLKTLQRISAISPVPEAVPMLYNAKLTTAFQVSEMPQAQFMMMMKNKGLDDASLMQLHNTAQQARVRNEHALMSLKEAGQDTGIAMIDKSMKITDSPNANNMRMESMSYTTSGSHDNAMETFKKNNLSWNLLFGDADFCECGECTSVYSAASYYVELLQYLRNNNLDIHATGTIQIKSDPKDITGTPLEKLFDRRPDLGCLELTCANTNTILPYVDLVNEVMENYVAFKHIKPFNVEDETSSELLAEPQHTEYQAYCILKNAVYPFTLPYHQPIDAARIYLKYLETGRDELIDTFRKNNVDSDATLTKLKDETIDRAVNAEFLNITKEEYVILTKECFESKALMDKIKSKVFTDTEYQDLIGVKPVCKYYGYDDDATMLGDSGLTQIKKEFLHCTGIDYFNLVDLLLTRFINPCIPKGKSKTIMESLRFSYRFLQAYAKVNGIDKMAEDLVRMEKLADLYPLLKDLIEGIQNKKALKCPNPSVEQIEITDKDIIHWVKCHFEKVGKMIVIESGTSCVNGEISVKGTDRLKILVKDCKIFYQDYNKQEIELGSIDKKTGKVTINDQQGGTKAGDLKDLVFIGEKGEKGIFMLIGNDIYLIFLEQKDSCNLDSALLQHLDGTPVTIEEYDKIHRFIRLWRKLDWSIDETDKAIIGLSAEDVAIVSSKINSTDDSICAADDNCAADDCKECDDCAETDFHHYDINPFLIHQLVAVKKLLDKTGIELIKLLSFWADISIAGEKSLYQRLFLKHNVLGIDKVFKADPTGNYLTGAIQITDHIPVLMASLNLSSEDIDDIREAAVMPDELTLKNLSTLYRYRLLSKAIGLKIPAFIVALPLFGDIFKNANATLQFIIHWSTMEDAGFTYQQLNYIIRNIDEVKKPFSPSQKQILQLAKTLYDGLNAIDLAHPDLKADDSITDASLQLLNIQDKAISPFVRAKASLLFDTNTVEKIIGLLEGTATFITNAPKSLLITLADGKTLKKKLLYIPTLGTVQITGILTDAESIDFKALSNDPKWAEALIRIEKQQKRLFKELMLGIFENEKTKTDANKTQLETIIKAGDIIIPLDQIPVGQENTNTAPQKRIAFLDIYLPYLRQQLTHSFVVTTLSGFAGLDNKITDVLISEILMLGTPEEPIYNIFEKIKESTKPVENDWTGYLIPSAEAAYTFIIRNSDPKPVISLDGLALDFNVQEDPTNEWWSTTLNLQSGKLYKLATTGIELKNIFWKTPSLSITAVPSSALIPDFASKQCEPALIELKKAAILISTFDLSVDEIKFFALHKIDFDNLNFNSLTLNQWLRLDAFTRLRNSLPTTKLNILDFWDWTDNATSDATKLSEKIAKLTDWKKENIDKLIADNHFKINKPENYRNEINLLKLQKALSVAGKIGMDINLLFDWAVPTSKFNICRGIADSIRNAIRAKYTQTDWEQVVKPLEDELRNHQKDALTAYLLQQKELIDWGVYDANGLFEFFLIDVQMDACMETSRIKQAISSVQLFVQRCMLGLEEEHNGITSDVLDRHRWEWMQRYRVWEANRKVFLYPENWIESNLRDDKSPFFKELESELLQKDINKQNVTDALKSYLYKVDDVANMEVVGLYIDKKDSQQSKDAKLHVFSRTRNAPYFFYYRYLDLNEMNWYPWEKVQIDIPSYDITDADNVVTGNGCYLTPVVWNNRLLVFFPQIMKKLKPSAASKTGSLNDLVNAPDGIGQSIPKEYYEIKMGMSEYRNKKWTQKQLSNNNLIIDYRTGRRIDQFSFIPDISDDKIIIHIEDQAVIDIATFKGFTFSGSIFNEDDQVSAIQNNIPSSINSEFGVTIFQKASNNIESVQLANNTWGNDHATFTVNPNSVSFNYSNANISAIDFYHPYTHELLNKVNLGRLEELFKYNLDMALDDFGPLDENNTSSTIYHELKRPYSLYHWELFFHTPTLLGDALSKAQQFEEAMKWYHFVFNPIADGKDDTRFWQFHPFKKINNQHVLDNIFNNLKPNKADQTISEWRDKPFMPHVVARSRPVAYMKWVVMKYLDNLIAWGDYLFRQYTIESINQATQLYILAWHILGERPMTIPKRGKIKPQTYLSLLDKWDAFGNAVVELELAAPFSNQTALPIGVINGEIAFANIFGLASTLYFCIPNNPKLMGYWDTLDDRLYKIRHCENIQGVFRKLPLFEPPIDPALLVKAAAQGLSIASVLNDLNTPLPNYRFYYLLQKALELCSELKSMGNGMLSAIEKKDNETIALIRAKHESVMQNLVMEVKKKQLEEAQKSLEGLQQNRKAPEHRMRYYLKLIGEDINKVPGDSDFTEIANSIENPVDEGGLKLIKYEKEDMDKASEAQDWQRGIGIVETLASIFHIIPSIEPKASPFGVGLGTVVFAGSMLGNAAQAVGRGLQVHASDLSFASSNSSKKGGFTRALQDRVMQANSAGYEIKQIDKQITSQKIRIELANQEITNQQKMIDNSLEIEDFLKNKYTNDELYTWMRGSLKTLYYQVYSLAYELSKKAEKVFRFERGLSSSNFIQSGYWDAGMDGLHAGEQLYVGLKQLEAAYQNERGYDYEITKHVSLRQINPLALMQLREKGICEFALPEILFDMDYPGHYKRRIKSVSVSIPCIVGPYTGINATFRLLENKFRNTAISGKAYEENTEETDERFSTYLIPITAIAASTAQNDSGMFELNFKDERYLPFEGAGTISKWRLELPDLQQFDYNTISDIIIHVLYTSSEGGERLKKSALESVKKFVKNNEELTQDQGLFTIIDLKHDLSTEWYKGTTIPDGDGKFFMDLSRTKQFIPYYISMGKSLKATDIVLATDLNDNGYALQDQPFNEGVKIGNLKTFSLTGQSFTISDWKLLLPPTAKDAKQMFMIVRMTIDK